MLQDHLRDSGLFSNGSTPSYASPTTFAPLSLHIYHPGDTWNNTTSLTISGNGRTLSGTGFTNETIKQVTVNGQAVLADIDTNSMQMAGEASYTTTDTTYFYQAANGSYVEIGDDKGPNNTLRLLSSPVVTWPSQWSGNINYTNALNFMNGDRESSAVTTQGAPDLQSLPDGSKATCWPLQEVDVDAKGQTVTSVEFWSPQLGAIVSGSGSAESNNGVTLQMTSKLTSYQFASGVG